jgi:hypothetical protein
MSPKHTPGPWTPCAGLPGRGITAVCDYADGVGPFRMIADFSAGDRPIAEAEANARLVAAAPDMLRDGRALVAWLREYVGADAWSEVVEKFPAPAVVDFIATLDRAEGGR